MSIYERLGALVAEGVLFPVRSSRWNNQRAIFLSEELNRALADPRSALNFFDQKAEIIGFFERWISGSKIAVRLDNDDRGAELARLLPPPEEIWEIRILSPRPQLRIFGRFIARDMLVVTAAWNRDQLGTAFTRKGKTSRSWMRAMHDCEREWSRLFGRAEPFRGHAIRDYVSENNH